MRPFLSRRLENVDDKTDAREQINVAFFFLFYIVDWFGRQDHRSWSCRGEIVDAPRQQYREIMSFLAAITGTRVELSAAFYAPILNDVPVRLGARRRDVSVISRNSSSTLTP